MAEYLSPDKKQEIFGQYGKSNTDTGSAESQVALFSYRIAHLTAHLKNNKKDYKLRQSHQSHYNPQIARNYHSCKQIQDGFG